MVFASKNYEEHNIQTVGGWSEWCDAINTDQKYCKSIKNIDEFIGKCKATDLPSWHPYWARSVYLSDVCIYNDFIKKISICINNPELVKVYFGLLESIDTLLIKKEQRLKSIKSNIFYNKKYLL